MRKAGVPRYQQIKPRGVELAHVAHDFDQAVGFEIAGLMVEALVQHLLLWHRLKLNHRKIAARSEAVVLIEHIGDAARHAGGKIAPGAAKHDHHSARHIFAAMIAGALDDCHRA